MHEKDIIHRDIKPENFLICETLENIKDEEFQSQTQAVDRTDDLLSPIKEVASPKEVS